MSVSIGKALRLIKDKLTSKSESKPNPALVFAQINTDPVLMQLLFEILNLEGQKPVWQGAYLYVETDLLLTVERIESIALAENKFRTCTRIHLIHPTLFPLGISEYQHAMGTTEAEAYNEGFRTWVKMDLLTLIDAIRDKPVNCTVIEMQANSQAARGNSFRQVILGPVAHLASKEAPKKKEAHPFCPCCLFTECMPAFHDLLQTDQFLGIRLFASRDNEGKLAADCRVNGEDFFPALEYLKQYAEKWPERGLEFRKQYVVVRSSRHSVNQVSITADGQTSN